MTDADIFGAAPQPASPPSAPVSMPVPRNNPGNLRPLPSGAWGGQTGVDGGFAVFGSPEAGQAAAEQNLIAKQTKHGLKTLNDIIGNPTYGWAPASDHNDPVSYAATVGKATGIDPSQPVDLVSNPALRQKVLSAMFSVEQGSAHPNIGQPAPPGLTPDEEKAWEALQPAAPTTEAGKKPGSGQFLVNGKTITAAQEAFYRDQKRFPNGIDTSPGMMGTPGMPWPLAPGSPLPQTPGAHYVDFDGKEHVVPGGALGFAKSVIAGGIQGALMDTASSVNRLTGGGLAAGDPMAAAFSQASGGPGAFDMAQAANQGFAQQAHDYSLAHAGDRAAQGGRFVGQAVPATAAAAAVPEIALPGRAAEGLGGVLANVGGKILTNAARGAAATAPSVGVNAAPVGQQLATGAAGGVLIPPVLSAAGKAGAAVAGLAHEATPEVAQLAQTAIDKYGIPLRAGQIAGVADRSAAYRDSNLLSAPGAGTAANNAQQAKAFTRGAAKTIGLDTDKLTPEAADQARRQIGSVFEEAAKKTGIRADDQLTSDLAQVGSQAREIGLDQSQINALDLQIKKITDLIATHRDSGVIPGDVYQTLTSAGSSLSKIMKNDHGSFADLASDIRGSLDDAVSRASSLEDQAALSNARFQWKNLKTLQPLIAKAGPDGTISPALLRSRVMAQFPNYAFGDGGDLGELARIGQTFMKEPPQSGTAPRLIDAFKGAQGSGILGGLTAGALSHDPGVGFGTAALPFVLGAGRLAGNITRGVLNDNPVARASVLRGAQQSGPIADALSRAANVTRPAQVPLSALGLNTVFNSFNGGGALSAVGTNPQ